MGFGCPYIGRCRWSPIPDQMPDGADLVAPTQALPCAIADSVNPSYQDLVLGEARDAGLKQRLFALAGILDSVQPDGQLLGFSKAARSRRRSDGVPLGTIVTGS